MNTLSAAPFATNSPRPRVGASFRPKFVDIQLRTGQLQRAIAVGYGPRSCEVMALTPIHWFQAGRPIVVAPGQTICISDSRLRFFPPLTYQVRFSEIGPKRMSWSAEMDAIDAASITSAIQRCGAFGRRDRFTVRPNIGGGAIEIGYAALQGTYSCTPVPDESQYVDDPAAVLAAVSAAA